MKITERRLRSIIRSVIRESRDPSLSFSKDLKYLSDTMGIDSLEDAIAHFEENQSSSLRNENVNRLLCKAIKESVNDKQKIESAMDLIDNNIKSASPESLEKATEVLSELQTETSVPLRIKIIGHALQILGLSISAIPVVLYIIAYISSVKSGVGYLGSFHNALFAEYLMGGIGGLLCQALGIRLGAKGQRMVEPGKKEYIDDELNYLSLKFKK